MTPLAEAIERVRHAATAAKTKTDGERVFVRITVADRDIILAAAEESERLRAALRELVEARTLVGNRQNLTIDDMDKAWKRYDAAWAAARALTGTGEK